MTWLDFESSRLFSSSSLDLTSSIRAALSNMKIVVQDFFFLPLFIFFSFFQKIKTENKERKQRKKTKKATVLLIPKTYKHLRLCQSTRFYPFLLSDQQRFPR